MIELKTKKTTNLAAITLRFCNKKNTINQLSFMRTHEFVSEIFPPRLHTRVA